MDLFHRYRYGCWSPVALHNINFGDRLLKSKYILAKISNYTTGIVVSMIILLGIEYSLQEFLGFSFDNAQMILFLSLISFFSLVRAILSLNVDLTSGPRMKWRLLGGFILWSVVSFVAGTYASLYAIEIIDEALFPIVSFLARIWKSYMLLFITCVNFISATLLFHKIANAIQIDTIEWYKRGFGDDGDPPRANLAPVAKKILLGLISQLTLNVVIFAFGSPEIFFQQMSVYFQDILALVGITA